MKTKAHENKQLPFSIDRTSSTSLTDQLVTGLASAIRCGIYRRGDTLPTISEISAAAGVSQIVTRRAIKRLADDGFVFTRQFHGIGVLGTGGAPRKGHVLIVTSELRDGVFVASVSAVLREALLKAGYITTHVSAVRFDEKSDRVDFSQLDALLDLPICIVVVLMDRWGIGRHVVESGRAPVVVFGLNPVEGATGFIRMSRSSAVADLAAHCAAAGIRKVMEVVMPGGLTVVSGLMANYGIEYEEWDVAADFDSEDIIETVQFGALKAFDERLAGGTRWLPDIVFLYDEDAATGVLMAFARHGIRIPEDVKLVTLSHRGLGPFYWKPLTRVEFDPRAAGRSVANFTLLALAGKPIPPNAAVDATYCVGDTFP